jgi:methionine synthase II (cobalamin-independent)
LVAERIVRLAKIVGRENVIAGADCGFAASALRFNPDSAVEKITGKNLGTVRS